LTRQFQRLILITEMKKYLSKGFTLVELLIVIALLGVIATIVIAAINPIEQANRATDAGMKADASQIVSAIERYYTTHSVFPWNAASCTTNGGSQCLNGAANGPDDAFPFISADNASVGVCGQTGAGCRTTARQGELIAALEIQKTFLSKNWVNPLNASATLWVGKAQGASSVIYVCWSPKSNSNRQVLIASQATNTNKMFDATQGFTATGIPTAGGCANVSAAGWTTGACVECVPE
jgi:prepilin-type N-terminal cleavage/methylation domain-containing protein